MFKGFNLMDVVGFGSATATLAAHGKAVCSEGSTSVRQSLEAFVNGAAIDGTRLQKHWFPKVEAHVFISHSHSDASLAFALAGWLDKVFGLKSFIDSAVWGYSDKLLKAIDRVNCWSKERQCYIYEKRNLSTSHVHMMLATALGHMIDSTECLLFLNTPQSITSKGAMEKTNSSWLLAELTMATTMRCAKPKRWQMAQLQQNFAAEDVMTKTASLKVEYEVDLTPFTTLTADTLNKWSDERTGGHPLDDLYRVAGVAGVESPTVYG